MCQVCGQKFKPSGQKPCALCLKFKDLVLSHAIPNASFKKISKGRQPVIVTANGRHPKGGNESFKTYQLCSGCEKFLNEEYDSYALPRLRGQKGKRILYGEGVTLRGIDLTKLQLFFLSVFWRAANSEHPAYSQVFIPEPWNNEIRECILNKQPVPLVLSTVRISLIKDQRKEISLNDEALAEIIMEPFHRLFDNNISFNFIFEGWFFEIFIPGLGLGERQSTGVINSERIRLACPFIHPYDIPEFSETIILGIQKDLEKKNGEQC